MRNLIIGRPILVFITIFLAATCVLLALEAGHPGAEPSSTSLAGRDPGSGQQTAAKDSGHGQLGPNKDLFLNLKPLDYRVLLIGNSVLLFATLISFYFYQRALRNNQVHAFLRSIYSGMLLKMAICIAAAFLYILLARHLVSKIAILGCFGLYLVYTFAEVNVLMQRSKQPKDA